MLKNLAMDNTVYIFMGTTAEYIKLIPLIRTPRKRKFEIRIVLSGQTDLEEKLSEFSQLTGKQAPYHVFRAKSTRSSSFLFAVWAIRTFWQSLVWARKEFSRGKNQHSIVIVQGDTVSAAMGAVTARIFGVNVAHVEAGLRTHNLLEPFPEEICRTLISLLTQIHFCPNKEACANLQHYGGKKVNTFFNTSVESLNLALSETSPEYKLPVRGKYFILIVHRQEHLYLHKGETSRLLNTIFKNTTKKIPCVFVVHDITEEYLKNIGKKDKIDMLKNVHPIPRLPYLKFVHLLKNCEFLITDGGGNHTESHFLGKPCLMLRKKGEQKEGLNKNIVVSEKPKIIANFMKNYKKYSRPKLKVKKWPSEIIMENIYS